MVTKVSISFDEDVAEEARARVGPQRLSRFVNESVRQRFQGLRIEELYATLSREYGEVPPHVRSEVAAEWQPDGEPGA